MTVEDLKFAETHKDWEMEDLDKDLMIKEIETTEDDTEDVVHNLITGETKIFIQEVSTIFDKNEEVIEVPTSCSCCGTELAEEGVKKVTDLPANAAVHDAGGNQLLKYMMKAHNEGFLYWDNKSILCFLLLFSMVSLICKGWSFSGSPPPPDIAKKEGLVFFGGAKWRTELDLLPLHFSKKLRGRLS